MSASAPDSCRYNSRKYWNLSARALLLTGLHAVLLQVSVWPFNFDARLDYSRAEVDKGFHYGCSCRVQTMSGSWLNTADAAFSQTKCFRMLYLEADCTLI